MHELIHEAVAAQARSSPEAVALVHRNERIGYATLDAAANTYAADLWARGIRPGQTVPVLLPRTPRLIAVLLAILKCGAAYAALDCRCPGSRITQLTTALRAPLVVPDGTLHQAAARRGSPPAVSLDGSAAATVFFTSGSTGVPKGVLSPHRATTRLFSGRLFADLGPGRVMLQAAPPSWDAFSLEVWGPLMSGGTCAVADTDHLLPGDLARLVTGAGVDTAFITSSLLNLLLDEDDPDRPCFAGMRHVMTGGERLSSTHVAEFLQRYPDCRLTNAYGPVENCVFTTTHRITAPDCDRPGGVPLGLPVSGTTVHIVDGEVTAGAGRVGEICLAGDGLALGYLDDLGATAAAFTSLVIDGVPRLVYRTGDLGLLDSDGVLHFRGRADRQIKISGHRIEPAEIECAARMVLGVRNVAVVPVPARGTGFDRLAMFYTTDRTPAMPPAAVRRALAVVLPPHLVPHIVRHRIAMPTTITGKLDHAALLDSL